MIPDQRKTILHSLGLTPAGKRQRRWSYRNYYCAAVPPPDLIVELYNAGWMRPGHAINDGTSRYYFVTREGAEAAGVLGRCRQEDVPR